LVKQQKLGAHFLWMTQTLIQTLTLTLIDVWPGDAIRDNIIRRYLLTYCVACTIGRGW